MLRVGLEQLKVFIGQLSDEIAANYKFKQPVFAAEIDLQTVFGLTPEPLVYRTKANCLRVCMHGPIGVVYPEAVWYGGVTLADVDEIVETHIIGERPVTRLMLKDECLNTKDCEHRDPTSKRLAQNS